MAGSGDNAGPRDEQGKLIHFPRSSWVPEDGVEPLGTTPPASGDATTATLEAPGRDVEAFEPDDFWDSGDTQQFVGAGGSTTPIGTPVSSDAAEPAGAGEPALATSSYAGGTTALGWRALRVPLPTTWVGAVLAAAALAAIGALIVSLTGGTSHTLARQSHATVARVVKPAKPWVAYSAKPHAAKRHVTRPRTAKPPSSGSSDSVAAPSSSQAAVPASAPAQLVYRPTPAASAASDSGSSSGGGGSSSGQSAGPTSPLGPGTSPSG